MRITGSLSVLILASVLVCGCGKGGGSGSGSESASAPPSKLVGDWDTSAPGVGAATVSYAADGTMSTSGAFTPAGKDAKLVITGTWKEDGDKVHMVYTDVKCTGLPPALQAKEKAIEDAAKTGVGMGNDNVMIVKFDGDDTFTSTDAKGVTSKFTRKVK